jgi:hypothetical protein
MRPPAAIPQAAPPVRLRKGRTTMPSKAKLRDHEIKSKISRGPRPGIPPLAKNAKDRAPHCVGNAPQLKA